MSFPKWYKQAEELYVSGVPYYKIGKEIGVHRKTVSHWLRKGGHQSNPKYVRHNVTTKIHHQNESVFENIDSEEKAYWLGFMYADGYISDAKNTIEVGLSEKDKAHLYKLKEFFETTQDVKEKNKRTKDKVYKGYRLSINSSQIKSDLVALGCTTRKSLTLEFPKNEQVPIELMRHFIRGYFDGDGCITHTSNKNRGIAVEILGTSSFIDDLIEWTGLEIRKHGFNHAKETFRVQMFSKNAEKFLHEIYRDATVYLDRKYHKFNQFAVQQRSGESAG